MCRMPGEKKFLFILSVMVFILVVHVASAYADTRYVSDMLVISVRDGRSPDAAVVGYIKTPTPVDVLETQGDYLKITTSAGLEGWVLAKYIVSEKPKALVIEDLEKQITQLKNDIETSDTNPGSLSDVSAETIQKYEGKIRQLEQQVETNQKLTDNARRDFKDLDKKYKDLLVHSGNTDKLMKEINQLKKSNARLNTEIVNLKKNSGSPLDSRRVQLFVAGAGVLIVGMMLGGSAKKKKKYKLT